MGCQRDTDERRRFAQVSHEYLIDQLQFTGDESTTTKVPKVKLSMNHPVKELVWVVQPEGNLETSTNGKQWFNFTDARATGDMADPFSELALQATYASGKNPVVRAKLQLNGHDRFSEKEGKYFNLVQPYQHHENIPATGINVYSFALRPQEHQPSGTCNMSRIDTASLNLELTDATVDGQAARIKVFGFSYNVLRIMSGMGGLAYSN